MEGVGGARIVIVNWRDPWHPQAGGAERYAWEMAQGLAARGAQVQFLTARAGGQSRRDQRDGIAIRRMGGRLTVYPLVLAWLLARRLGSRNRGFDAVLDCQNGIPFFTPWALPRRTPVLCVVHHVHADQFGVHFPEWAARFGRWLEGPVARRAYRRHACVAVSPSTVATMRARLRWTGDIYLIPNGVRLPPAQPARPGTGTSIVWVGRLVAHKRAELVLPVAGRLRAGGVAVDVVGRGPAGPALAAQVTAAGLDGAVRWHGFLPEADKQAVMAGAALHLSTSQAEGWGLTVLEAAALGVPTVAFDVDGLRDAVRDGQTGWLVRAGERIEDVTERAVKELADPVRRAEVASACRAWAARLPWDRSTQRMADLVAAAIGQGTFRARRRPGRAGVACGAWIVSRPGPRGGGRMVLAEGPVLDRLLSADPAARPVRPATALERLLGTPDPDGSPQPGGGPR